MQIQTIPLSQLKPHPRNVRKTGGGSIRDLACSIAAHGLLHPLVVSPMGDGFEVVAGARRLAAIKALDEDRLLPAQLASGIPCQVMEAGSVTELSLAENVIRQAMHPADEFDAFRALVEEGQTIEAVATRFGVKARHVEERLRLANVAPQLLDVFREGGMTLEQVMALSVVDDHAAQVEVWGDDRKLSWERQPNRLRESLVEREITSDDGIAEFIGLDAYTEAGGKVRPDLFSDIVVLEDGALLNRLATAKLKERADQLKCEGWGWVEAKLSWPYQERHQFKVIEAAKPMPLLGVIVTIGNGGKFEVHKGLLRPGDKAPANAKPKGDKKAQKTAAGNPMAEVNNRLTAVRTGAIRAALREDQGAALALLVATLAADRFNLRGEMATGLCGDLSVMPYNGNVTAKEVINAVDPVGVKDAAAWRKAVEAGVKKYGSVLVWLLKNPSQVDPLLLYLAVEVVDPEPYGADAAALMHQAITEIGVDLSKHWQLTPEWLQAQGRPYILVALEQAMGKAKFDMGGWASLKPAVLPEQAHKALVAAGWLPAPMRAPEAKAGKKVKGKR